MIEVVKLFTPDDKQAGQNRKYVSVLIIYKKISKAIYFSYYTFKLFDANLE